MHVGLSSRHVNTYHHNSSLLFQFILAEFVEAYEELRRLSALCHRQHVLVNGTGYSTSSSHPLQIEALLIRLVGSRDFMRLFSWNFKEGILPKLRTYCALFLRNAENDEKEILTLQHYADKIWQASLQAMDVLNEEPESRPNFTLAIDKAEAAAHRLGKQLMRVLVHFCEDENVILSVLKLSERLDKLYGPRFVAKILLKMYPKGLREAQQMLTKKYTERGFDHVLPVIHAKMAEIEAPCL